MSASLRLPLGLGLILLGACAQLPTTPAAPAPLADRLGKPGAVLLGEVHDNAAIHAFRLAALREALARGWRPALAFEQFDVARQADIERARAEKPGDADYLIAQAAPAGKGWNWDFYKPLVALALQYDLPIVAANFSRQQAGELVRQTLARGDGAAVLAQWPADIVAGQRRAVEEGHCGQIGEPMLSAMVQAQVVRDQTMAAALRPHLARGVVLLAGNGHVRRDIGVPRWLDGAEAVGLLESADAAAYSASYVLPAQPRPDPCAALRKP